MKYMGIAEYQKKRFTEESRPELKTLRSWIDNGELPGKRIGRKYFVNITLEEKATGNPLVDKVLRNEE